MHLYPILLVLVIVAADGGMGVPPESAFFAREGLARWAVLAAWGPVALIAGLVWLGVHLCEKQLDAGRGARPIIRADRLAHWGRWAIIGSHAAAVLVFGWLDAVRGVVGSLILVDEIVALLPAALGLIATWWAYYPMERRMRDALLIRRLDEGLPVHPMPSRGRYVWMQAQLGLLILLVPILLILGLAQTIRMIGNDAGAPHLVEGATLIAAAGVFLCAPLAVRAFLSVEPLPEGPVRDDLMEVCRRHGVKVRELLLWRTSGTMINAAVMGLIRPLRYVLITDALLESMSAEQVRAVMAHEVGHVRRHHMPWMVLTLMAMIVMTGLLMEMPLRLMGAVGGSVLHGEPWVIGSFMAAQLTVVLLAFGWVCRRFERQADTFAVQHLSGLGGATGTSGPQRIESEAVRAMQSALDAVAHLHGDDVHRPNWRHGSIAWRQGYLETIIGAPLENPPVDRLIRRIKQASAVVLLLAAALWLTLPG